MAYRYFATPARKFIIGDKLFTFEYVTTPSFNIQQFDITAKILATNSYGLNNIGPDWDFGVVGQWIHDHESGMRTVGIVLAIVMLLGGLWHGAAWNVVLWGLWHGAGLALTRSSISNFQFSILNSKVGRSLAWLATMLFVFYGWLLFRATSLSQITAMTRALGDFTAPAWITSFVLNLIVFTLPLAAMELWQHKTRNLLAPLALPSWLLMTLQGALLTAVILFWDKKGSTFIYFQF